MLKELTVRCLEAHEQFRAGDLLEQEHYLGDCPTGRQLMQVVEYQGHWVALLNWGQRVGGLPTEKPIWGGLIESEPSFWD